MSITHFYASIQKQLEKQLPFVAYRKAGENSIQTFLQKNDTLFKTQDYADTGFVFAPFDSQDKAIIIPSEHSTYATAIVEINNTTQTIKDRKVFEHFSNSNYKSDTAQSIHHNLVTKGIEAISANHFKKVVLSRCEAIKRPIVDPIELFKRLLHNYNNAFVYVWYHPKVGTWLGATPETLIKIEDNNFFTMALAGTQAYVDTLNVDWGKKELEEQKMVTSFVVSQLSSIVQEVQCSDTYTHKAGTLLHLRTDIKGALKIQNSSIKDIIEVLHPTPAVCGLPKSEAKSFILANEGYARKYYTGFLGELNIIRDDKKETNIFVNLRCMELAQDRVKLYVGGGITKDSDPEKEWEETVKKTETMKKVLL